MLYIFDLEKESDNQYYIFSDLKYVARLYHVAGFQLLIQLQSEFVMNLVKTYQRSLLFAKLFAKLPNLGNDDNSPQGQILYFTFILQNKIEACLC